VARGDGPEYEEAFQKLKGQVEGDSDANFLVRAKNLASSQQVADEVQAALDNTSAFLRAHQRVRELDDTGDYQRAVDLATKRDVPDGSVVAFESLDKNLINALNSARQEFLDQTLTARQALTALVPGFVVLLLIATAGIVLGITQRLREYR
jgi:hypothetical protein